MPTWVVRQDPVELAGRVTQVWPADSWTGVGVWTFMVDPDPADRGFLTTRNGNTKKERARAATAGNGS